MSLFFRESKEKASPITLQDLQIGFQEYVVENGIPSDPRIVMNTAVDKYLEDQRLGQAILEDGEVRPYIPSYLLKVFNPSKVIIDHYGKNSDLREALLRVVIGSRKGD